MVSPFMVYMMYKIRAYLEFSHCSSIAGGLEGRQKYLAQQESGSEILWCL